MRVLILFLVLAGPLTLPVRARWSGIISTPGFRPLPLLPKPMTGSKAARPRRCARPSSRSLMPG
jgi:hypothetical protein